MGDTQVADQSDFVLRRRQDMGSVLRPKHLRGMRIERYHHRCSVDRMSMTRGSRNDRLMTAVHTIEDADGKKNWSAQLCQIGNRLQRFHELNDE